MGLSLGGFRTQRNPPPLPVPATALVKKWGVRIKAHTSGACPPVYATISIPSLSRMVTVAVPDGTETVTRSSFETRAIWKSCSFSNTRSSTILILTVVEKLSAGMNGSCAGRA